MDASKYKDIVLGLIFIKYISDAFEERHANLVKEGFGKEDKDAYRGVKIFWVPKKARWKYIHENSKSENPGKLVNDAMYAIEHDNPALKDILSKDYLQQGLGEEILGDVINTINNINVGNTGESSQDTLGQVYEYFLGQFAKQMGRNAGEFYTPRTIVELLVKMVEPYKGRVYDPCCGSGGMFVQSQDFIKCRQNGNGNGGKAKEGIAIYGQESNYSTWKLAKMNLAIRGIDGIIKFGNSFHNDLHPDLKADYILANPPFNMKAWGKDRLQEDQRWKYGIPKGNANFAWIQHFIHHLSPSGIAGFVLSNVSMSSNTSGDGEIRKSIVEEDIVDCMVALPPNLFYNTAIPACLWFISKNKNHKVNNRKNHILFINAHKLGIMLDRKHRELTNKDIKKISGTYHSWKGSIRQKYKDIPGFCKSVSLKEIGKHNHNLTPGRYVESEVIKDDGMLFSKKIKNLTQEYAKLSTESKKLDIEIRKNLKEIGFEI